MKTRAVLSPEILPYLAVSVTIVLWGLSFVSSKTILNAGVPPIPMVAMRFILTDRGGVVIILGVLMVSRKPAPPAAEKTEAGTGGAPGRRNQPGGTVSGFARPAITV
jgi:hypothetical protein